MAQKKRISDEAFPWVKKTAGGTKPEAKDSTMKKSAPTANKNIKAAKAAVVDAPVTSLTAKPKSVAVASASSVKTTPANRKDADLADTVFVLFDNRGTILSVAKVHRQYLPASGMPFETTGKNQAAEIPVPDEFTEKSIAEIHQQCIVRGIDSKPYLAKK